MKRNWIIFVTLFWIVTACNLPNQTINTPLPTLETDRPSQISFTPTPVPLETLLARATPTFLPTAVRTPRLALASPINQPVNCRYGPSTAYAVVGGLDVGDQAEIVGKNIDVTWWVVKNPNDPSTLCWLAADLVVTAGNTDLLPVVSAPPAQVTAIQITTDPPSLNVACNSFPRYVTVNADIIANGPTTVTFRWETSEEEMINADSLLFLEADSKSAFIYYRITTAKDYWIQVHILSPNDTSNRITFKATCTP
jgi:hypothetical protein